MKNKLLKNLLLSFLSLLIIIIISELVLKLFIPPLKSGWGWQDSPRRNLSNFENDFPNQLNVRGQRIEYSTDDFVILLIGDSQVEAATSAPSLMPEKILQNYLNAGLKKSNVKVFSLAASGWGQDQQLLALEKYYKNYRANLILVWTTPKNDFWENTFPDRSLTKVAGHLKPTFYLKNQKLEGPFFKPNNYYKNSVLIQILFSAIQNLEDKTLEQKILDEWLNKLPVPHNFNSDIKEIYWSENKEIDLDEFSENLFKYKNEDSLTILTYEDFINSRSHFSPYSMKKSPRDNYLISITKELFDKMKMTANKNGSDFLVFYPQREDYDLIYEKCIKFVKLKSGPNYIFAINLDYQSLLKKIITQEKLICFKVTGGEELSLSNKDRHLSDVGNKKVMELIAENIKHILEK